MKILSVLGAVGFGILAASWLNARRRPFQSHAGLLNINQASQEEIMRVLGLDSDIAERIVEHRPYPSKLDLLGRMVVPEQIYATIKDRIAYKAS